MSSERSGHPEVVVVGSAMTDLIAYVDRIPHPGETMPATGFTQGFGGKGANQAAAAAMQGVACSMVACVGDDLFGPPTIADLRSFGVDTSYVATVAGQPTGTASILVEPSGENRIALAVGANRCLGADRVDAALREIGAGPSAGPTVVACQLETPQDGSIAAFEWARSRGATTVLTPGPAVELSPDLASLCDWMVPNEVELLALLGLAADHPVDDALERAVQYSEERRVGLIVTVGAAGAVVVLDGSAQRVPAPAVVAVDTTGAGDAFAGSYVAALARGVAPLSAVRGAVAFASDSVTRRGTRAAYPAADAQRFTVARER